MKHPTKKGEKFKLRYSDNSLSRKTFTVLSFFGHSGIEYATYAEAVTNTENADLICIKNAEYGGVCAIENARLMV